MKEAIIIGHRGASAYSPENTIESFKRALTMKAKAMECDVRMSKDKKLMVIHDETIDRTTSGKGFVKDLTSEELKKHKIPELKELIELLKEKDVLLLIEIKEPGTEKQVVSMIKDERMDSRTAIVSFFPEAIEKAKKFDNKIRTGLIYSRVTGKEMDIAIKSKADWILPRRNLIDKELIQNAHEEGLKIMTWTVDNKQEAEELIKIGIDGIASNKPDLLYS